MCLIFSFTYKITEAHILDWLRGGVKTIIVEMPTKTYEYGDTIPQEYIREIIAKYATGTKAYQMERTIYCESYNKNIQSYIIDRNGNREDSWGIAQINIFWNPTVTKEQALDPVFAIKWTSERWGKTKWYGYISKTDSCNIIYK